REGYILHCTLGDWTSLVEWVAADGKAEDLLGEGWEDFNHRRVHAEHLFDVLDGWVKDHTVADIMDGAQLRRIPYATVRPPGALPSPSRSRRSPARALDGIVVLDFTWVVAGPLATRMLADHGAHVIKIERADALDFGTRRGGFTGNLNRGKESVVLAMNHPEGLALARQLVARADVVIDNFSARVMRNWGLDYAGLAAIRPD